MMYTLEDIKENKGHTLVCWNTHSLFPCLDEVERIIDLASPDLIGIVESWLSSSITDDMIAMHEYNILRMDRNKNSGKHGGGESCITIEAT